MLNVLWFSPTTRICIIKVSILRRERSTAAGPQDCSMHNLCRWQDIRTLHELWWERFNWNTCKRISCCSKRSQHWYEPKSAEEGQLLPYGRCWARRLTYHCQCGQPFLFYKERSEHSHRLALDICSSSTRVPSQRWNCLRRKDRCWNSQRHASWVVVHTWRQGCSALSWCEILTSRRPYRQRIDCCATWHNRWASWTSQIVWGNRTK